MGSPTAYWGTLPLIRSLSVSGWGALSGRRYQGLRSTLQALAHCLPSKSGEGMATAYQIADAAGLSDRTVRTRLAELEDLGIITWTRGGVIDGRPRPGFFRIVKRKLVALIADAKAALHDKLAKRRDDTAARLSCLRQRAVFKRRNTRKSASSHAETTSSPLTPNGGGPSPRGLHPRSTASPPSAGRTAQYEYAAVEALTRKAAARQTADAAIDALAERRGITDKGQAARAWLKERFARRKR